MAKTKSIAGMVRALPQNTPMARQAEQWRPPVERAERVLRGEQWRPVGGIGHNSSPTPPTTGALVDVNLNVLTDDDGNILTDSNS